MFLHYKIDYKGPIECQGDMDQFDVDILYNLKYKTNNICKKYADEVIDIVSSKIDIDYISKQDVRFKEYIVNNTKDKEFHKFFFNHKNEHYRKELARNKHIDDNMQLKLAGESKMVRDRLAGNQSLCLSVQWLLSCGKAENAIVRRVLAGNKSLNHAIQVFMTNDESYLVRARLANNQNICKSAQIILTNDKDDEVRVYLANNASIDPYVQNILSVDNDSYVRAVLYRNPSLDKNIKLMMEKKGF